MENTNNYIIDYKKELNQQQYDAVTSIKGPVLIIAGAGSGKTRCLTYKVSYLIENGIQPEKILLLTFTNKAANEMKERSENMLDKRCSKITACTYHSFCVKILRRYAFVLGYSSNFGIMDTSDCKDVISMIKAEHEFQKEKTFPQSSQLASLFSVSVNKNIGLYDLINNEMFGYSQYKHLQKQIYIVKNGYEKYKKENNLMDFDDLLYNFYKLLKREKIRKKIEESYDYIMVDEYQDSNHLQEMIVMEMRKNNKNLTVVGDDSQCIYGFRGSEVQNIIDFPQKMENCKTIFLTNNYRSNQEIMNLSNELMKTHSTEGFPKVMKATYYKKLKPIQVLVNDDTQEAEYIIKKIKELHDKGIKNKDICILQRSSKESFYLESLLNKEKIPYEKYGGIKFFEKKCIRDVIAFARVLTNSYDEIAWYRVLQMYEGIGKTYARRIASECKADGREALINKKYKNRKFYNGLIELFNMLNSLDPENPKETLENICEYYIELQNKILNISHIKNDTLVELKIVLENAKLDFDILIDMINEYKNLISFLDDLILDGNDKANKKQKEDKVIISTIHSAKGLEYHTVFILNCANGVFPKIPDEYEGTSEDNEELRCFYVAITRAKENLILLTPESVYINGKSIFVDGCRYLDGLEKTYETLRYTQI